MGKIVVMVVDRQPFLRTALQRKIAQVNSAEEIEVIECDPGVDGDEAVVQIDAVSPDAVLLDIGYPERDGLKLCKKIVRSTPQTKVVMLTSNPVEDDDELFEVIKSGASAYLITEFSTPQELVETIERASRGEYPIHDSVINRPQVALRVQRQFEEIVCNVRSDDEISTQLNPKEVEILTLVIKGKENKEIGKVMGLSDSSVKRHITSTLRKLNANDRAHAVVLAVRGGIVSIQPNDSSSLCNSAVLAEAPDTMKEPSQIIGDARYTGSKMLSDAEEIARQIIDEAEQEGKDNANKIIAQAVLEAEQSASQIMEETRKTKSEILADAEATAKQIIDEAEQKIEDNASGILAEVLAVAEQQAGEIIEKAKQKAEVDSNAIFEKGRQAAQSSIEQMKERAEIEASRVIAEAEQKGKQVVEAANYRAKSEAAVIIVESHKKASRMLQEVGNIESRILTDAEEAAKQLTEAKQKGEEDASRIVAEAEQQAGKLIEEARNKAEDEANEILEEGRKAAQSVTGELKSQAEVEANRMIAEAEQKAKQVVGAASNVAKSEASGVVAEAHKKASEIIEEAVVTVAKMRAEAEETASLIADEARQKGEENARQIITEAEHQASEIIAQAKQKAESNSTRILSEAESKVSHIIEQAGFKNREIRGNENAESSKLYEGVVELALDPPVNVSTMCALHKQLKQNPNVDVLNTKGSVDEGLKIRMLIRTPIPLLEFIKGLSAVKYASVNDTPVQSQTGDGARRILVKTY